MATTKEKSVFETLKAVNVNDKVEKKNGLTYLSWAWAWGVLLEHYPNSDYTIYEDSNGNNYHTDGKTCWVKTGVTVEGRELIEYLPIMDFRNASISADKVTSVDVNKAIQRSLTKVIARHGLGLYIYAGEDLPDGEESAGQTTAKAPAKTSIDKPFLNQGTPEWTKVETALKNKTGTLSQVLTKYHVSKANKELLEKIK